MSREQRKKQRKARNAEIRANPPAPVIDPVLAARDPATRWTNLTARGGAKISLVPVGPRIPVDLDDPTAPVALALHLTQGSGVDEA
jgi:hypothetical protein